MDRGNGQVGEHDGRRQVRFAFLATIGSMLFGGFFGALIVLALVNPARPDPGLPRWAIVLSEALILLPLALVIQRRRLPPVVVFRLRGVSPGTLRDTVLIGLGASVLIDELDRLVALVFPLPENIARGMEFLTFATPLEALLVVGGAVLVAPLVEELVFRGFFQGQLEQGYRDATKAVLFSAALFMILHFNPWWSLQIYLLGVILGYLAWRTASIWPAVVVHAVNNSLAVWFANVTEDSLAWYAPGGHVSLVWLLLAAMMAYFGFRSLLVRNPEPLLTPQGGYAQGRQG